MNVDAVHLKGHLSMASTGADPDDFEESGSLLGRLERVWEAAAATDGKLPAEPVLASALTASRPALREALVRLEERGYIARRQGTETAVNRALLDIPVRIDEKASNATIIDALGMTSRVELLTMRWDDATAAERKRFHVNDSHGVLRTTKVWYADDTAMILAEDVIPVRIDGLSRTLVDARTSIFELSEQLGNRRAEWETVWLAAASLDEVRAPLLHGTPGEAVLEFDVTGVTRDGATAYWGSELHRPAAGKYAMVRSLTSR